MVAWQYGTIIAKSSKHNHDSDTSKVHTFTASHHIIKENPQDTAVRQML